MMGQIKEESIGMLYNLEVQVQPAVDARDHVHLTGGGLEAETGVDQSKLEYVAPSEDGDAETLDSTGHVRPEGGASAQKVTGTLMLTVYRHMKSIKSKKRISTWSFLTALSNVSTVTITCGESSAKQ